MVINTNSKNNKKVVLLHPHPLPYSRNWYGMPLALLSISRILDKEGYDIKIFSRFLQDDYVKGILEECNDSICLGITAITGFQIKDGLAVARLVKEKYPHLPIIWGGWHPSILPEETIKDINVDIIVKGQGERTFAELVDALSAGKKIDNIPGIVYKRGDSIMNNPNRLLERLDNFPDLPYHLLDVEKCLKETEYGLRTLEYISSYGCPYRCGFCVEEIVNKRKWVGLSSDRVVEELESFVKNYNIDSIAIYDSNFFVDKMRVYEICSQLLKKNIRIKWGSVNGRMSQLVKYEPEIWELMARSGCSMILVGAESGSQEALDLVTKDMNIEDSYEFTRLCKKHGIKILYSYMVGLPWSSNIAENKERLDKEYKATLSSIDKLLGIGGRQRFMFYLFLPYPGARLFERAAELGLEYPKRFEDWSDFLMSPEDAFNMVVKQKWITPGQAQFTAMLTQYIFGIMDVEAMDYLKERIKNRLMRRIFVVSFKFALILVRLRWKYKFFRMPLDYKIFIWVRQHAGLM